MGSVPKGRRNKPPPEEGVQPLLQQPRLELLPLKSIGEAAANAPEGSTLTVTCSPKSGVDATLRSVEEISSHPGTVVPHLAARMVRDRAHLGEVLKAAQRLGIKDVFVPGGDASEPLGEFTSSLELLQAMDELGHPFEEIGVAGYPEGHWMVEHDALYDTLRQKQRFATYVVSQMCFSSESIANWLQTLPAQGIELDPFIGIAGAIDKAKLATIAPKLGIGQSLRFLKHNKGMLGSMLGGLTYTPTDLVQELDHRLDGGARPLGFHIYTFNQVQKTEEWRRQMLGGASASTQAS
jgi:methylenetetrahydrofolate reductase (NADPH)